MLNQHDKGLFWLRLWGFPQMINVSYKWTLFEREPEVGVNESVFHILVKIGAEFLSKMILEIANDSFAHEVAFGVTSGLEINLLRKNILIVSILSRK